MHPTTLPLFLLAASAYAAVLPHSQFGSWAVTVTKPAYANGYRSTIVSAVYTSDSYPNGLTSTCTYVYDGANSPAETSSCDPVTFSYTYDGSTVSLQQVVNLPTNETVFGSAALELTPDAVGELFTGETTVEVTSAIAQGFSSWLRSV